MKIFPQSDLEAAYAFAMAGGQALHLHRLVPVSAPQCFRRDVEAGRWVAHLLDQDAMRLVRTAKRLGVRIALVEGLGTKRQHIDLCGAPLRRAREEAEAEAVLAGEVEAC